MNHHSQTGFTLIETLLYIGLFVFIMGAIVMTTYNMIAASDKTQYRSLIHNEAQFVIRKLNWLLNDATSVSISGSTLTVITPSGNHILALVGSKIQADGIDLNSDIAPVTTLSFVANPPAGSPKPVDLQMSFQISNVYYNEIFTTKELVR
jgi:hypothetical protein